MNNRRLVLSLACFGILGAVSGCDEEGMIVLMGGEDKKPAVVCNEGETRCADDASAVLVCAADGMSFEVAQECKVAENEICDATLACVNAENAKVCLDDQFKCADDAEGIVKCVDGNWSDDVMLCTGAQICVSGKCVDKVCSEGDIRCSGAGYVKCAGNAWDDAVNECAEGEACVEKDGVAACQKVTQAVCKDSEIQCDAKDKQHKKYVSCVDGQWSTEASSCEGDKICENGACVAPCINGDTKCADATSLQTCSNGAWGDAAACPANESCNNGSCVCKAGAKKCDGKSIVTCGSNGKWLTDNAEKCAQGCDPASDAPFCFECENNAIQCTGSGEFQICVDHKWQTFEKCGGKQCWGQKRPNGAIIACQCGNDNQERTACSDDGTSLLACMTKTVEVNGAKFTYLGGWGTKLTSDGGKCENGKNGPECTCKGKDSKCEGNVLYNCQNFAWTEVMACKEDTTCNAELNACVCEEGTYNCTNNHTQQFCKDGKWVDSAECTRSQYCSNADGGACIFPSCINSSQSGNFTSNVVCGDPSTILKCENRRYVEGQICSKSQMCAYQVGSTSTVYCAKYSDDTTCYRPGQMRCSLDGMSVQECKRTGISLKWTATACSEKQVCVASGNGNQVKAVCSDKVCDNYSYTCDKDKIMFCNNNELKEFADCASVGRTCKDGQCVTK